MRQTINCKACEELEFELEADFTPHVPAKTSGPPERCHPEEPAEVEVTRLTGLLMRVHGPYRDGRRELVDHRIALRPETSRLLLEDLLADDHMLALFTEAVLDRAAE